MKITVEMVNGGYIVQVEGEAQQRVYKIIEDYKMWEELGRKLFGRRITVQDK